MKARQRIVRTRRQYNQWVGSQTLEDYALRYTAAKARKSAFRVGNTALGAISFLACEAIGGAITIAYGFPNAPWAIAGVALLTHEYPMTVLKAPRKQARGPDPSELVRLLVSLWVHGRSGNAPFDVW
jgi:hypothetical protein